MVRRLAQTEIDDKGRTQVPLLVRKYVDLKKTDVLTWWLADEQILITKLGSGTPLPKFRDFVP